MPTVDKLVQATKGLKVKDVPQAVGKFAGEHYNVKETSSRLVQWFHGYKAQHIDSGSPKPLFDVLGYGFVFAYALAWPQEYAHYKHEQEMKLKGGH
mmetsp:Transcript_3657/g.10508  ORF Transcript_3657/g.10508 Transcript_3657/m.10508 type:complete len:96 (-) Transcript_3657:68-355(-)|eukprot:CAMPEP_0182609034 /NCGR_PEP_ID=MMETSP1330-20130603/3266_1 /TAXON_ID=464278 /ORGANISM="Picochlorum sp., Strain RCC944" /LENGTH=95 /DNA_ID=CAMNT_0024827855 /DNA_START=184 /DNA_END=471 /DNA_ORIENTATION=+